MHKTKYGVWFVAVVVAASVSPAPLLADTLRVDARHDTSIFSESLNSNALGGNIYTGRNNNGDSRRGLIAFDVVGTMPANATVTEVSVTLCLAGAAEVDDESRATSLHRVIQGWGEGSSNSGPGPAGGRGASPTMGDATWMHARYSDQQWSASGGSFVAFPSATRDVGTMSRESGGSPTPPTDPTCVPITWLSTPTLVQDVQGWLANPATDFGWLIRGDEGGDGTIRRFYSREAGEPLEPYMTVTFTTPTTTIPGDANGDSTVTRMDLAILARNYGRMTGATSGHGDFNADGAVDLYDLGLLQSNYGTVALAPTATAVPEPSAVALVLICLPTSVVFTLRVKKLRHPAHQPKSVL